MTVVPMSGGMTERQVQLIGDFGPQVIAATPSYALAIADEMERQGGHGRASALEVGVFGAEPWSEGMRSEIEARLGIDAVDIYGLSEVIGPGVANECIETKDGLHIWEDHFYPEIVDPATGEALPEGELGELVLTSLTKEAMPVIRYRTRDLTRLMPGTARSMRRMARIAGRSDDMLIIRGCNLFPSQIEELLAADPQAHAPLSPRAEARGAARYADRRRRGAAGGRRCRSTSLGRGRSRPPSQGAYRSHRRRRCPRPRRRRALARQGQAPDRSPRAPVISMPVDLATRSLATRWRDGARPAQAFSLRTWPAR